jgi:hypothetical protein
MAWIFRNVEMSLFLYKLMIFDESAFRFSAEYAFFKAPYNSSIFIGAKIKKSHQEKG